MQRNNSHPGFASPESIDRGVQFLAWASRVLAVSVEPVWHRRLGARAIGIPGAIAALAMLIWPALWHRSNPWPIWCFDLLYVGLCVASRVQSLRLECAGYGGHTRYSGYPRLLRWLPALSEVKCKQFVEPLLTLTIGAITTGLNAPLGSYLCLSAVGLFACENVPLSMQRAKLRDLNDMMLEMQQLAEDLRTYNRQRN